MNPWHGDFTSRQYSPMFVNGKIRVELPDILRGRIDTVATIKYTGLYRTGQRAQVSLSGTPESGTGSQPSYSFKGGFANQEITFNCTSIDLNEIKGNYKTLHPSDAGTFTLKRGAEPLEEVSECILL